MLLCGIRPGKPAFRNDRMHGYHYGQGCTGGMDEAWLGRHFDKKMLADLKELKPQVQGDLAGEGGEYETLVLNAPFFRKKDKNY